jgi:hypothetical protein
VHVRCYLPESGLVCFCPARCNLFGNLCSSKQGVGASGCILGIRILGGPGICTSAQYQIEVSTYDVIYRLVYPSFALKLVICRPSMLIVIRLDAGVDSPIFG